MSAPQHYRSNVDNSAWDASKAMSTCANGPTPASCYGSICAGKKTGDTSTQAAWALPHHYPGKGPNSAGTRNALARLGSTQGLTNEAAARSHLEAHMKQINPDYQPSKSARLLVARPSFRRMSAYAEAGQGPQIPNGTARLHGFKAQMRAKLIKQNGQEFYEVEGYASVTDTPYTMYDMFGPYEETIRSGAFDISLANPELNTAFLVNHLGVAMARTTNGRLTLWADSTGLGARALLNAHRQDVRDIVAAIDDHDVEEMSFAFYLLAGGWNEDFDHFTIYEADIDRGDVSAVNFGANPYTSIGARQSEILAELDHLPDGAARAAVTALRRRLAPSMRALTSMDADESVNELIAALDATLDSASDLVVGVDPASCPPEVAQALDLLTGAEALADQLMDMLGIDDPDDTDTEPRTAGPHIIPSVPLASGRTGVADWPVVDETGEDDDDGERAAGGNPADATHGAYSGAHTHMHAANGAQGSDEMHTHAHSHNGDGSHSHPHPKAATDPVVESGMSTELAVQLLALDDEHERDKEADLV